MVMTSLHVQRDEASRCYDTVKLGKAIPIRLLIVADLGGTPPARAPLRPKIFTISCSFLENVAKIIGWHPLLKGWRPLLRGILDPPLSQNCSVRRGGSRIPSIPRGGANPPGGGANLRFCQKFPINCMKLRKFWVVRGGRRLDTHWYAN